MNFFDAHLHYVGDDINQLSKTAESSKYKDIFYDKLLF